MKRLEIAIVEPGHVASFLKPRGRWKPRRKRYTEEKMREYLLAPGLTGVSLRVRPGSIQLAHFIDELGPARASMGLRPLDLAIESWAGEKDNDPTLADYEDGFTYGFEGHEQALIHGALELRCNAESEVFADKATGKLKLSNPKSDDYLRGVAAGFEAYRRRHAPTSPVVLVFLGLDLRWNYKPADRDNDGHIDNSFPPEMESLFPGGWMRMCYSSSAYWLDRQLKSAERQKELIPLVGAYITPPRRGKDGLKMGNLPFWADAWKTGRVDTVTVYIGLDQSRIRTSPQNPWTTLPVVIDWINETSANDNGGIAIAA